MNFSKKIIKKKKKSMKILIGYFLRILFMNLMTLIILEGNLFYNILIHKILQN